MPFYDLKCGECGEAFNVMASMSDKSEKRIPCPACGSKELSTAWRSAPAVIKGSPSAAPSCPNAHVCGSGCRHTG